MKTAVYPGSFDPVTNGHLDIIERAAAIFDRVIVAVSVNSKKQPLFTMEERVKLLKEVLAPYDNVEVDYFEGLTVDYVIKKQAQTIIRGLRAVSDFENEFQMAITNKKLRPQVETLFMMSKANYSFLSSSLIKEIASFKGCIREFVPDIVEGALRSRFSQ